MSQPKEAGGATAEGVLRAAGEAVRATPGARVFIFVDSGPDSEPSVFASGDDDTAADLILTVGEWLDAPFEDEDEED